MLHYPSAVPTYVHREPICLQKFLMIHLNSPNLLFSTLHDLLITLQPNFSSVSKSIQVPYNFEIEKCRKKAELVPKVRLDCMYWVNLVFFGGGQSFQQL